MADCRAQAWRTLEPTPGACATTDLYSCSSLCLECCSPKTPGGSFSILLRSLLLSGEADFLMSTAPFSEAPCLSPVLERQLHNGKAVVDLISLCPLLSDTVPGAWWMLPGGFWNEQMSGALLPLPSPTWGFPGHLGSSGTVINAGDYPVAHSSRPCSPDSHSKRMRHSRKTCAWWPQSTLGGPSPGQACGSTHYWAGSPAS
ncbi:uncharacterized protein LOC115894882 [Rhinopithecus roxellana]|uniref:uncharacterized protein LOC115894882 n=1 Tax=Rhinopithecus roxellana TaxID=61622 RepID=UPI0012373DBD|nr:uncharacterized protein LOC115894882 [Rhinopithecus roxellana]